MTATGSILQNPAEISADAFEQSLHRQTRLSAALSSVFRGKFCDVILTDRKTTTFGKRAVIYDVGDSERTFFFLQRGFVRVGTISADGREVIYDVRKSGDVAGELCAAEGLRPDRAVALEETVAFCVPFQEVLEAVAKRPETLALLVDLFGAALKAAYEQVNSLALDDTMRRVVKVLLGLAARIGEPTGTIVEIPVYLTQEEIAQMVAARRERVSTALNELRRRGLARYSPHGHMMLYVRALETDLQ